MITETAATSQATEHHTAGNRLGSFLCWAVVFADIGTSVYYVPGILYGQYGRLAGLFVFLTFSVFVLLTIKYAEVTERFPEGGGVVTVARAALNPWAGALGGMLILVDYFLTASLSSISGIQYFQVVLPRIGPIVLWIAVGVLVILGLLNWWGIKESASVSAVVACIALISDVFVLIMVSIHVPIGTLAATFREMFSGRHLTGLTLITGFAGSFLAFSGLESISQLSPVMRVPRRRVAGWALALVVVTVGLTSPFLTVFSTTLLCPKSVVENGLLTCVAATGRNVDPNQFISALGGAYGGPWLAVGVAISASALLVFASNTAIIGSYHVFLALTRLGFFPKVVSRYNHFRETPHVAIGLATGIPIAVLIAARGEINLLGDLYAFGLLGAFTLTCLGLDIIRWRERHGGARVGPSAAEEARELAAQERADALEPRREPPPRMRTIMTTAHEWETAQRAWLRSSQTGRTVFLPMARVARRVWPDVKYYLGFLTTALVLLAWSVNIMNKPLATRFGGGVTLLGLAIAIANHRLQERAGQPAIIPMHIFGRIPHAQLVVLPGGTSPRAMAAREAVIRAATEHVNGHNLVFLYVQPAAKPMTPHFMAINDPYAHDLEAQQAFSHAAQLATQQGVPRRARQYVYRIGGLPQVAEVWRIARPEVTVALADQGLARLVQPRFVRFQTIDGMRVAFYVHQMPVAAPEASAAASPWRRWLAFPPLAPGRPRQETSGHTPGQRGAPQPTPPPMPPHEPAVGAGGSTTAPPMADRAPTPRPAEPNEQTGAPASPDHAPGATGSTAPATTPEHAAHDPALDAVMPPGSLEDADRYVWTGTELKRRDELAGAPPAPPEHDPSPHEDS